MGVYIKGMEMPEHCDECYIREKDTCPLTKTNVTGWGIPLNCPLVPVPPHGRLGDLDALTERFWDGQCYFTDAIKGKLKSAPTIIPAEEEGE